MIVASGGTIDVPNSNTLSLLNVTVTVDGGTVSQSGGGSIGIAYVADSTAVLQVQSGTVSAKRLVFGAASSSNNQVGTFDLNGGSIIVSQIGVGNTGGTGNISTFTFNGGTLKVADSAYAATFLQGLTAANVKDGGAKIDANGTNITMAQSLLHSAGATTDGLTKSGAGSLTLAGANTYSGLTSVQQGTLILTGSAIGTVTGGVDVATGAIFSPGGVYVIGNGKTLSGGGTVTQAVDGADAIINPGNNPGVLAIEAGLTLDAASTLNFELASPVSTVDDEVKFSVTATRSLILDGTLNIIDVGGFGVGQYTLFSGATSITDNGLLLGAAPSGYAFSVTNDGQSVFLNVSLVPEPASLAILLVVGTAAVAGGRRRTTDA